MPWSAFMQSLLQGKTNQTNVATQPASPQRCAASTTRASSTQAHPVKDAKKNRIQQWERYFIDVSEYQILILCNVRG